MARPRRIWNPDGHYHIGMRGNNRQRIFHNQNDINEFFRIINYAYHKYSFELYAFCIMPNHHHLLLQSPKMHIGKVMSLINKRYSDYYRKKYDYTGQIYENRYYANEVNDPVSILDVSSYIHQNPIKTKQPLVKVMEDYPYSSFQYYYHKTPCPYPFLNLQLLPTLVHQIPKPKGPRPRDYVEYCINYINKPNNGPA